MPSRGRLKPLFALRIARDGDRSSLRGIDLSAWTLRENPILPDGTLWSGDDVDMTDVIVASLEEQVVGYVHLADALPPHVFTAAHAGRIRGFAVAPDVRARGLGTALMEAACEEARERGYRKLVLQVLSTNHAAQRLYERLGFLCEGRITGLFYLQGAYVDDLWYARWL